MLIIVSRITIEMNGEHFWLLVHAGFMCNYRKYLIKVIATTFLNLVLWMLTCCLLKTWKRVIVCLRFVCVYLLLWDIWRSDQNVQFMH